MSGGRPARLRRLRLTVSARSRLFRPAVAAASALVLVPLVALGSASPARAGLPQPPSVEHITVVLALPPGAQPDGTTVQDVVDAVNGPVAAFWNSESRGAITVVGSAGAPGWVATTRGCDTTDSYGMFWDAAQATHAPLGQGEHLLLYIPPGGSGSLSGCADGYGGLGNTVRPGQGDMYVRTVSAPLIEHQLGHNLGLSDAGILHCEPATQPNLACSYSSTQEPYDVMADPIQHAGSLDAIEAATLGLLPPAELADISGFSGTRDITLHPLSATAGTRAVRFKSPTGSVVWLEYRGATGQDAWLADPSTAGGAQAGVVARAEGYDELDSTVVDPSPSVQSAWPADQQVALTEGRSANFRLMGMTVTVRSMSPSQAVVRVVVDDTPFPRDLDHNHSADLVAAGPDGTLYRYASAMFGFGARTVIGHGWQNRDLITMAGDWDGLGNAQDVIAREPSTGNLWLYSGNGTGGLRAGRVIGHGWQTISALFSPGDWDGDGNVDLLARRRSDGALILYPGNGTGGFGVPRQVGSGWNAITALVATGEFTGTLGNQFLARASDGTLYLYVGDGNGGFLGRRVVGHGWQVYSAVIGVGSWASGVADVLALDHEGNVRLYLGEGAGILFAGSGIIGHGWTGYRLAS